MKRRIRIDLVDQREYAFHGCLPEEALIGSDYLINLSVWAKVGLSAASDELEDTVAVSYTHLTLPTSDLV